MDQLDIFPTKLETHSEDYKKARQTLKSAFPKVEQSPFWALALLSKHKGVDFLTWHNKEGQYIGISYSIHHNNKMMLLYLATEPTARNKGYGTKIIRYLQNKDNIQETVLDIESPYQTSENTQQRQRRLKFYKRLGFYETYNEIIEPHCNYLILGTSTNPNSSVQTYVELTSLLTSNLCHLNIKKLE